MTSPSKPDETGISPSNKLHRSRTDRVVAGVAGGLGAHFGVDPIWIRLAFVVLTLGGGSGILVYVVMWLLIPGAPEGDEPHPAAIRGLPGAAIVGLVLIALGSVALVDAVAPWIGRYFWPVAFVVGGLALLMGGLNRDRDR